MTPDSLDLDYERVVQCKSLREALVMSASFIGDILDAMMKSKGYGDAWTGEYECFCREVEKDTGGLQGEDLEIHEFFWDYAATLFRLYRIHPELNDTTLFEKCIEGWEGVDELPPELWLKKLWGGILAYMSGWTAL